VGKAVVKSEMSIAVTLLTAILCLAFSGCSSPFHTSHNDRVRCLNKHFPDNTDTPSNTADFALGVRKSWSISDGEYGFIRMYESEEKAQQNLQGGAPGRVSRHGKFLYSAKSGGDKQVADCLGAASVDIEVSSLEKEAAIAPLQTEQAEGVADELLRCIVRDGDSKAHECAELSRLQTVDIHCFPAAEPVTACEIVVPDSEVRLWVGNTSGAWEKEDERPHAAPAEAIGSTQTPPADAKAAGTTLASELATCANKMDLTEYQCAASKRSSTFDIHCSPPKYQYVDCVIEVDRSPVASFTNKTGIWALYN
jgi:hypothetical protein